MTMQLRWLPLQDSSNSIPLCALIAESLLESLELLNNGVTIFREKCIEEIIPNKEKCQENLEKSAVLAAALVHHIGYDRAAHIARKALRRR